MKTLKLTPMSALPASLSAAPLLSVALLAASLLSASCGPAPATTGSLTFVHEYEEQMVLVLGGEGEATIDWGDGSAPQTVTLTPFEDRENDHDTAHTYTEGSGTKSVTVTGRVTGIDIGGIESYYLVTSLDVSGMPMLQYLGCVGTQLTSLDVGGLAELKELVVAHNSIASLDVSRNGKLTVLDCAVNDLTSLDVGGLAVLNRLDISGNKFEADAIRAVFAALPDRTGNPEPATITCDPYPEGESYEYFFGAPNPGWASITEADRKTVADKNWTLEGYAGPSPLTLVTPVEGEVTLFAVAGSGEATIDWGDGSAPQTVTLEALTFFDDGDMMHDRHRVPHTYASGSGVKTVTITGDITALDTFDIYPSSIDAGGIQGLELLHSYSSHLTSLDIDGCAALEDLMVDYSKLTAVPLGEFPALRRFSCKHSEISSLDIDGCAALEYINIGSSRLEAGAIRAVFAALPDRTDRRQGEIYGDGQVWIDETDVNPGWASITDADKEALSGRNWIVDKYVEPVW